MMKEPNLIQTQQTAVDALLSAREQGPRAASYRMTTLNRNPRVVRGVRSKYARQAERMGFRPDQIERQWRDVIDMAELEATAE